MKEFKRLLTAKIDQSLANSYSDNYDYIRYGPEEKTEFKRYLINATKRILFSFLPPFRKREISLLQSLLDNYSNSLNNLFLLLHDEASKQLLVDIAAFRILGHRKVKLPLSTPDYWNMLKRIESMKDPSQSMDPHFMNFILHRFNLKELGYPIQLFFSGVGILIDFYIRQYELKRDGILISAMPGDVVIDGGACWGDTALFFANEAGSSGKVYSFEFIPGNIEIFNRNLNLNPELKNRIELVRHPLWSHSSLPLYFTDAGPGSGVSLDKPVHFDGTSETITIDDFVKRKNADRIDFIKLDIEGAELEALKGAEQTLRTFKPKLAVALYHRLQDFKDIPLFLDSLRLGYKFYLSHCTIHSEESILFATT